MNTWITHATNVICNIKSYNQYNLENKLIYYYYSMATVQDVYATMLNI